MDGLDVVEDLSFQVFDPRTEWIDDIPSPQDDAVIPWKLFVRAYTDDGSSKSILVDEKMTVAQVVDILLAKNHFTPNLNWAVVESLPDLYMERMLEDHDNVVENLLMWTRDSNNKLLFVERPGKYDVFKHPEEYLLSQGTESNVKHGESSRQALVQEFFSIDSGGHIPEVEGMLYLKSEGKKAWKRFYFVLRASGIYYNPKGKSKSSRDLVCLQQLDFVDIYRGRGWKKKYKAPTDYCFALKHPQIQKKASKYIKYLCAEDVYILRRWVVGIRIAKHGSQLLMNYESTRNSIATWDERDVIPGHSLNDLHMDSGTSTHGSDSTSWRNSSSSGGSGMRTRRDSRDSLASSDSSHSKHSKHSSLSGNDFMDSSDHGSYDTVIRRKSSGSESSSEVHRTPAKMTPILPVTTEVTKQLSEQVAAHARERRSPQTLKRNKHGSMRRSEEPPPPPPNTNKELHVEVQNLRASQEFPPPPSPIMGGGSSQGTPTRKSEPPAPQHQPGRPLAKHNSFSTRISDTPSGIMVGVVGQQRPQLQPAPASPAKPSSPPEGIKYLHEQHKNELNKYKLQQSGAMSPQPMKHAIPVEQPNVPGAISPPVQHAGMTDTQSHHMGLQNHSVPMSPQMPHVNSHPGALSPMVQHSGPQSPMIHQSGAQQSPMMHQSGAPQSPHAGAMSPQLQHTGVHQQQPAMHPGAMSPQPKHVGLQHDMSSPLGATQHAHVMNTHTVQSVPNSPMHTPHQPHHGGFVATHRRSGSTGAPPPPPAPKPKPPPPQRRDSAGKMTLPNEGKPNFMQDLQRALAQKASGMNATPPSPKPIPHSASTVSQQSIREQHYQVPAAIPRPVPPKPVQHQYHEPAPLSPGLENPEDLPPPPAELLEGLPPKPVNSASLKKKPPPPPKRSQETHLSSPRRQPSMS